MTKQGRCTECQAVTRESRSGLCRKCWRERPTAPKPQRMCPKCGTTPITSKTAKTCSACYYSRGQKEPPKVLCRVCQERPVSLSGSKPYSVCAVCYATRRVECQGVHEGEDNPRDGIRKLLKGGPKTLDALGAAIQQSPGQVLDLILEMKQAGVNLHQFGSQWSLESSQPSGGISEKKLISDKDGWHRIGAISDTHLCSKHERLDVLNDAYRIFEANGIKTVLHSGNWIDGEARFNKFELKVHGMDAQLQYLGEHYPQKPGMETWTITGDDHEGWYAQREGVDIGKYAENVMRDGGRTDWVNLGYMEAFIPMVHATSGKQSMYHLMHPGGGSAYATSYTVQKIVEGYEGGAKPAVLQAGHYHKTSWLPIRNVWTLQPGCTQDQTVFARKNKIAFSIAATILTLRQNPDTGAIEEAGCYQKIYFNPGYYTNNRWSLSGPVTQVPRVVL